MKRTYTKPELFCEEYELSVSIAGNCGVEMRTHEVNTNDWKTCGFKMGFDWLFVSETNCNTRPEGEDGDNGICYMQPIESAKVFHS